MINVQTFGAKGDGVTDDTAAIQAAYNHAAQLMGTPGGAGVVYFPESSGFYLVGNLTIPSMSWQGWLTSVFDNGLLVTGSIFPGNWNAFIGRTSNFAGLSGSFVWGPYAEWQKTKYTPGPVVDMQGTDQVYFEGINFANQNYASGSPAVHLHNNAAGGGCVYTTFNRCLFINDLLIDYVPPNNAGFGLRMYQCSVNGEIDMSFYGDVTIRDSYIRNIIARQSTQGIKLENILSESLNGTDFFEWHGPGSDLLIMDNVGVADSSNSYLIKLVKDPSPGQQWGPSIKLINNCNAPSGLINPSAAWCSPSLWVEGLHTDISNMQGPMSATQGGMSCGLTWTPGWGLKLYGSQNPGQNPNPLWIVKGDGTVVTPG